MKIFGKPNINRINTTIKVPNLGDHRICMSTVILSLTTGTASEIKNFETVRTYSQISNFNSWHQTTPLLAQANQITFIDTTIISKEIFVIYPCFDLIHGQHTNQHPRPRDRCTPSSKSRVGVGNGHDGQCSQNNLHHTSSSLFVLQ